VPRMTPENEAAYALRWNVDREDLSPAVQAEYDRLKIESETRQAEPYTIGPPPPDTFSRQPPPWAYFLPILVIWAVGIFWLAIAPHITEQVSFGTLRSDISQVRLPPGYVRVSSAQSGRDCARLDSNCALAEFWVWHGSTPRSASAACRDIGRAMTAVYADAEPNSPPPRGAACDYNDTIGSFLRPGLGKRDFDAFVWTGSRAAVSPGGLQVELESSNFFDFTPLRSP
jgi:hypothetical protein